MAILTKILKQFSLFNCLVEVHENMENPNRYNVTIEYSENYWFFGFLKRLRVRRFMRRLEYLINKEMSALFTKSSDIHHSLSKEKTGIMSEEYKGKLMFTLTKSPISDLVDCFHSYRSKIVSTDSFWHKDNNPNANIFCSDKNVYHFFSSLGGVR